MFQYLYLAVMYGHRANDLQIIYLASDFASQTTIDTGLIWEISRVLFRLLASASIF